MPELTRYDVSNHSFDLVYLLGFQWSVSTGSVCKLGTPYIVRSAPQETRSRGSMHGCTVRCWGAGHLAFVKLLLCTELSYIALVLWVSVGMLVKSCSVGHERVA